MGANESGNRGNTLTFEEININRGVMTMAALDTAVAQRIKQFQAKHNL